MENVYTNNSSKVTKLNALSCEVSPINAQRENQQYFLSPGRYYNLPPSPLLDSYTLTDATNMENLDSPLIKYLRSGSPVANSSHGFKTPVLDSPKYRQMIGYQYHNSHSNINSTDSLRGSSRSPLSSIENLASPPARSQPLFQTPVKVEEDVLVMDAIQVGSVPGARGRSASSSDSGGSSSSGNKACYRTDICRSWEDSGRCRYGSKCQAETKIICIDQNNGTPTVIPCLSKFAHGKEELRPTRPPHKSKSEPQTCKAHTSGSCKNGSKCRFIHHHQTTPSASPTEPPVACATTPIVSPLKLKTATTSTITFTSTDWSPQDDGIEVALPSSFSSTVKAPSREEVDAYINSILHGPPQTKRLQVFADICPE